MTSENPSSGDRSLPSFLSLSPVPFNKPSPRVPVHKRSVLFWLSSLMENESVLFIRSDDGPPKAPLLFQPTRILKVCDSSGEVTYVQGQDFAWKPGSQEITLLSGSRVVFKTPQELRRPAKSQPYVLTHRDGNGEVLFGGGHEYHDMQTVVTYEHAIDAWTGPAPTFAAKELPNTIKLLSHEKPLKIALLGDSISTGCNASGWARIARFQPPYQDPGSPSRSGL